MLEALVPLFTSWAPVHPHAGPEQIHFKLEKAGLAAGMLFHFDIFDSREETNHWIGLGFLVINLEQPSQVEFFSRVFCKCS